MLYDTFWHSTYFSKYLLSKTMAANMEQIAYPSGARKKNVILITSKHSPMGQDRLQLVMEHINSFSTAKYLEGNISSKAQIWVLYTKWLNEYHPDHQLVKQYYYRDCLQKHFGHLKLAKTKKDTCTNQTDDEDYDYYYREL